jgi:hypothetical protein
MMADTIFMSILIYLINRGTTVSIKSNAILTNEHTLIKFPEVIKEVKRWIEFLG